MLSIVAKTIAEPVTDELSCYIYFIMMFSSIRVEYSRLTYYGWDDIDELLFISQVHAALQ